MSEVLELTADEPKPDTAAKRALIESELRKDPDRSDREIGRVCGVDGKTVSAARAKMAQRAEISPQSSPTPTEHRQMLINAGKAFDAKYPSPSGETPEEVVDRMLADGKISHATAGRGGVGDEVAARPGAPVAETVAKLAPEVDSDMQLYFSIPQQAAIECRALTDGGVEIWQEGHHGSDEDAIIHVAAGNVVQLARHILYAAGFKNIHIYTYEKGAGNVDIDDGHLASNYYEDDKPGYGRVP